MTAGSVQTVKGDVDPSSLGVTLTHEHLLLSLLGPDGPPPVSDERGAQPIALENVGWVRRNWSSSTDNLLLDEEDTAIDELRLFKDAGGTTLVEASNPDLKRDAAGLLRIAQASGVQVVMGCGHYIDEYHPADMDERTEEQLVEEIVADVTEGRDGAGIKAGIIGEIGCSAPMTDNERRALRAAARAQRRTGAALLIHPGRDVSAPLEAMDVVVDADGDPQRTIMSHLDRTLFEHQDMIELAKTGCYLEFDLFGQESSYYPLSPIDMPNDAMRVNHLQRLIAEGFGDKLLIAQDICRKAGLVKYGGDGYAHILRNVVPVMKRKGMTEEQIEAVLVRNPARVLPMAQPAP